MNVYEGALDCALNGDLKREWETFLDQTKTHVARLEEVCRAFGFDPAEETAGCRVVRHTGQALVEAMRMAKGSGTPEEAELVAGDCVSLAEAKDHADWELLSICAKQMSGEGADTLKEACDAIEEQEDDHLFHSKGWWRELWLQSLGLKAVLPPPEEKTGVKGVIAASEAMRESITARLH